MGIRKIYWIIKYEFRGSHKIVRNFKFEFPAKNFPPKYDSFALWQISCCWFLIFPAKRYRRVRDIGLSRLVKNMKNVKNVKNVKNTKTILISQKSLPVTNLRFLKMAGNSNFWRETETLIFDVLHDFVVENFLAKIGNPQNIFIIITLFLRIGYFDEKFFSEYFFLLLNLSIRKIFPIYYHV